MGPVITAEAKQRITDLIGQGVQRRRRARRRRARARAAGLRARLLPRRLAVRPRDQGHDHLQRGDLRAGPLRCVRAGGYEEAADLVNSNEYGNGTAIFTRDGDTARAFADQHRSRHGRHQCADPGSGRLSLLRRLEAIAVRRSLDLWARRRALLHAAQDRDRTLADRHPRRRRVQFPELEVGRSLAGGLVSPLLIACLDMNEIWH